MREPGGKPSRERVLLSFTGFHDPFSPGLVEGVECAGPILALVRAREFDRVILFSTPNTLTHTAQTKVALADRHSALRLEVRAVDLDDPTDYLRILRGLRHHWGEISEGCPHADFFIAVASGTPQMHACWLLLAASGEIPGRILHVRPPQFVTASLPLVSEVDLTAAEFPCVRVRAPVLDLPEAPITNPHGAIAQLGIVGDHPRMQRALEIAAALASSNTPILICGETGTGKELVARLIHLLSERSSGPFLAVNCAAIPHDLAESILFGHRRGAFTGATTGQLGRFDLADGGTLFLDELAELPMETQAKLLRVVQDAQVEPLGGRKPHRVDVRLVAATNQELSQAMRERRFREDLYYRLAAGEILLPPLRERRTDIPKIALHILDRINATLRKPKRLSPSALGRLQNHSWPGNVRELQNTLERSIRLARSEVLEAEDLLISEPTPSVDPWANLPEPHDGFAIESYLAGCRKQLVLRALEIAGGKQSAAAKLLGITPQAVHKFIKTAQHFNPS